MRLIEIVVSGGISSYLKAASIFENHRNDLLVDIMLNMLRNFLCLVDTI